NKLRLVSGEERHPARYVFSMSQAPDWNFCNDLAKNLSGNGADHFCIDITGRNRVNGYPVPGPLLSQRLGEAVDARLGGSIVDLPVLTGLPVDTADIHNATELTLAHTLKCQFAKVVACTQVGIEDGIPHIPAHAQQRRVAGDTGVVYENLDRSVFRRD